MFNARGGIDFGLRDIAIRQKNVLRRCSAVDNALILVSNGFILEARHNAFFAETRRKRVAFTISHGI